MIDEFEKDKEQLQKSLQAAQIQYSRIEGALMFVEEKIKKLKEVEDEGERTDNTE